MHLEQAKSHAKKTKEMTIDFDIKGIIVPPSNLNGVVVERVTTYTYCIWGVEKDNRLTFNECAQNKSKTLLKRMFLLRKLNHFRLDSCILQMFYKALLQSVLSFGLIGNRYIKDQKKLQRIVQTASKIIGVDQVSVAQLYMTSIKKIKKIPNSKWLDSPASSECLK